MPSKKDKTSQAERFMNYMVSGDPNRPMATATSPDGRVQTEDELNEQFDNYGEVDYDDLTTPGQIMDSIFAQMINQVARLEARLDYILELAVQQGWFEQAVTPAMIDQMIADRRQAAQDVEKNETKGATDGQQQHESGRAYRREGKSGVGYVIRPHKEFDDISGDE